MADPQILQDFTPILKNVYLPIRKKIFPINTVLLAMARKLGPEHVTYAGNDLMFDVKVERRGGFNSSAAGFIGASKIAREKQGRLSVSRNYAKVQVDGLALKATNDSKGSYISAAKKLVEDVMDQWEIEQERMLHGDSLAVKAVIGTVTDTTHIIASAPYGITSSGVGNLHLVDGDDIAVLNGTTFALRGKSQISSHSVSGDNATFVLTTAIGGMVANDVIVACVPASVDATDTSFGAEPHGLKSIMDVEASFATFEGINDPRWVANKISSATIDETLVMKLLNTIRARAGVDWRKDSKNMLLLTTTGIWQAYGETLLGLRRFSAPEMNLKGGFTGVQVANATLVDDPWGPRGRLYAVYGPDTCFIDLMDFGEISFQDAPKYQRVSNRDAWEAVFAAYWNYGVLNRISQGVIYNITDTVNYSPVFA